MAARVDGNVLDFLSRTTGMWDYNSTYTVSFWIYFVAIPGAWLAVYNHYNTANSKQDAIFINPSGTKWTCDINGNDTSGADTPALTTWYHVALVRSSTTLLTLYINGASEASRSDNIAGRSAATTLRLGYDTVNGAVSARYDDLKIWTRALSVDEINAQRRTRRVQNPTSLNSAYPFWPGATPRITDYSGNGYNLTNNGTITDEDPAPIGWGAPVQYVNAGASLSLDQYGYRFRWDDGDEASATWQAAQNANISFARNENFRLRTGINATNDPPSHAYKLQYRSTDSLDWRDVQN